MDDSSSLRVLIAGNLAEDLQDLAIQLHHHGHKVIGSMSSNRQTTTVIQQQQPDVILVDVDALGPDAEKVCSAILGERICPILLVGTLPAKEAISPDSLSACVYLRKPVQVRTLTEIINRLGTLSIKDPNWLYTLISVHEILDARFAILDAAMYLAHRDRCSQAEAMERIHQEARAKRAELANVARAVLLKETVPYYYDVPI